MQHGENNDSVHAHARSAVTLLTHVGLTVMLSVLLLHVLQDGCLLPSLRDSFHQFALIIKTWILSELRFPKRQRRVNAALAVFV